MENSKKITLHYVNKSKNPDPEYADKGSSGFDLRAWITEDNGGQYDIISRTCNLTLKPFERILIHTGLYFNIPENTEIQVRPRSGLALREGISLINSIGTIDESYVGECCLLVVNLSTKNYTIFNGDRIAQAVLMPVYNGNSVELLSSEQINKKTERGNGGMGHTGIK